MPVTNDWSQSRLLGGPPSNRLRHGGFPRSGRPFGNVKRFLLECLPRAKGERVTLGAVYARYRRWCEETKATAVPATVFAEEFKDIFERVALRTRQDGTKIYCLDVKLVA